MHKVERKRVVKNKLWNQFRETREKLIQCRIDMIQLITEEEYFFHLDDDDLNFYYSIPILKRDGQQLMVESDEEIDMEIGMSKF
jgi:hypothetical protein